MSRAFEVWAEDLRASGELSKRLMRVALAALGGECAARGLLDLRNDQAALQSAAHMIRLAWVETLRCFPEALACIEDDRTADERTARLCRESPHDGEVHRRRLADWSARRGPDLGWMADPIYTVLQGQARPKRWLMMPTLGERAEEYARQTVQASFERLLHVPRRARAQTELVDEPAVPCGAEFVLAREAVYREVGELIRIAKLPDLPARAALRAMQRVAEGRAADESNDPRTRVCLALLLASCTRPGQGLTWAARGPSSALEQARKWLGSGLVGESTWTVAMLALGLWVRLWPERTAIGIAAFCQAFTGACSGREPTALKRLKPAFQAAGLEPNDAGPWLGLWQFAGSNLADFEVRELHQELGWPEDDNQRFRRIVQVRVSEALR